MNEHGHGQGQANKKQRHEQPRWTFPDLLTIRRRDRGDNRLPDDDGDGECGKRHGPRCARGGLGRQRGRACRGGDAEQGGARRGRVRDGRRGVGGRVCDGGRGRRVGDGCCGVWRAERAGDGWGGIRDGRGGVCRVSVGLSQRSVSCAGLPVGAVAVTVRVVEDAAAVEVTMTASGVVVTVAGPSPLRPSVFGTARLSS